MPCKEITKTIQKKDNTIQKIADIILNIQDYKNFIPHCTHSKIIHKENELIIAEITISFTKFNISYTSKIIFTQTENILQILVTECGTSVFKRLINTWQVEEKADNITIKFKVDFEIKNVILNLAAKASLPFVTEAILNAFIKKLT